MSILSRLEAALDKGVDLVTGGGRRVGNIAVQSLKVGGDLTGLGADLITAPFTDDEYDGFLNTIKGVSNKRIWGGDPAYGPGAMTHLFGPRGTLGLVIEAVPEPIREGTNATFEAWEVGYRQIARVPATAITAASLALSDEEAGDVWEQAWEMSDPWGGDPRANTIGRALSFLLFDIDVLDEEEVARHEGTAWHNYVSGTTDFAAMFFLDPTIVGGKVVKAARGAGWVGRVASRAGVPGTRATLNVLGRHRPGGAADRLLIRPYVRARYRKNPARVTAEGVEMTRRELVLAGGQSGVRNRLRTQTIRRERYLRKNGRFDSLLREVDGFLAEAAGELGYAVTHAAHSGRGAGSAASVFGPAVRPTARYPDEVYQLAAGRVRQRLFYKNPHGAAISDMLVRAYGGGRGFTSPGRQAAEDVMRFFLGDNAAIARIADQSDEAANFLKGIFVANGTVNTGVLPGMVGGHVNQHAIRQALMPVTDPAIADDIGELAGRFDILDRMIAPGLYNAGRDIVRQSYWYTNSITGKPFRWVFDKRAHPHVLFASTTSDLMVERMLRQAKIHPDEIARIVAKWNGMDEAARRRAWPELIQEVIDDVVERNFPGMKGAARKDLIKNLVEDYSRSARHAEDELRRHITGTPLAARLERLENGSVGATTDDLARRFKDTDPKDLQRIAQTPERLSDVGFIPDFTRLNRSARRLKWAEAVMGNTRGLDAIYGGIDAADHVLTVFSNIWKPSVLLNPKWPMRVVGEEQLRMAAIIGGPDALFNLLTSGRRGLGESALRNLLSDQEILRLLDVDDVESALRVILGPRTFKVDPGRGVRAGIIGFAIAGAPGAAIAMGVSTSRNQGIIRRLATTVKARQQALDLLAVGDEAGARAIMEAAGFDNLQILNMDVRRHFGNPAQPLTEWENAASSNRGMTYMLARQGSQFKQDEIKMLGAWDDVVFPPVGILRNNADDVAKYEIWYERVLNDQYGRSPFSQMFYDDALTNDDIVGWLLHGPSPMGTRVPRQALDKYGKGGPKVLDELDLLDASPEELGVLVDSIREITERLLPKMDELAGLRAAKANGVRVELRQVIEALGGEKGLLRVHPPVLGPPSPVATGSVFGPGKAKIRPGAPGGPAKQETLFWNDILQGVHKQEEIGYGKFAWFKKIMDRGISRLGGLTTTHLSRHPLFRVVYADEMQRKVFNLKAGADGTYELTPAALKAMEDAARITALDAVKTMMYELAEASNFADSTRHFFPFFNAWQEVLTRWVGLTARNPEFVAKMAVTFRESGGLPTYEDPEGNTWIVVSLPEWGTELVSHSPLWGDVLDHIEAVHLNRDSVNMITQGLPGFMPTFVFAVGEVAKRHPEVQEILSFMFPYGLTPSSPEGLVSVGTVEQFSRSAAPAWGRQLFTTFKLLTEELESGLLDDKWDLVDAWEDRSAGAAMRFIAQTWAAKMENGEMPYRDFSDPAVVADFDRSIVHAARVTASLMAFAKLVSPTSVKLVSPYQDEIDLFRRYYNENPGTAEDKFFEHLAAQDMEGSFWYLTARATQSREGLPSTMDAIDFRDEFEDLYMDYPELGGLILGFDGGGSSRMSAEWLAAAYENQIISETSRGSGEKQRYRFSLMEWLQQPPIRQGWSEYRAINDEFYAWLAEPTEEYPMGIPNKLVGAARPYVELRQSLVDNLEARNPLWAEDYNTQDPKWEKRIEGMRVIADDDRFIGRSDIQALRDYLAARDEITSMLAEIKRGGGSAKLDSPAPTNQALRKTWETIVQDMLDNNPTFRDIHERWFEFDMLTSETWPEDQRTRARIR